MRFIRQSLTGLFLLALTFALIVYAGSLVRDAVQSRMSDERRAPQARERVFAVNVVTAQPGTVTPVLTAFGEVESARTLEVRAATGGTLVQLAPEFVEGGKVAAGQLLARTNPANAQAALDRVRADILDAEAEEREAVRALALAQDELRAAEDQVALRERAYQRQIDLSERGVGTAAAVETAELSVSTARQQVLTRTQAVAQAEARIDQAATRLARQSIALAEAERNLADTEITAEFSGRLTDVAVVQGGLVTAGEQLARLIDPEALEVAFRVSTEQYARLLDDAGVLQPRDVVVTLDTLTTPLSVPGRLTREGASVGEGQTGRLLFATLPQARGLKPGDFVTVAVDEPALDRVTRLPAMALNAANEVLVLGEDDRLEVIPVTLLRRQGDDVLVRARGLAGRDVVAERTPLLGAGIKVRPLRPGQGSEPEAPAMVELDDERRAKLIAFVEGNTRMPDAVKQRLLGQLAESQVPAATVDRLESRMGG